MGSHGRSSNASSRCGNTRSPDSTRAVRYDKLPAVTNPAEGDESAGPSPSPIVRGLVVIGLLYLFLSGVAMLESGINTLGSDVQADLFSRVSNPIAGVCVGILGTVLVQGTKLAGAVLNRFVAFEIDGYEPEERTAWSVVIKGNASAIERMQEVFDAEDLPLFPWLAWEKPNFVRIDPTSVTGRRYHIVDDITPDTSIGWTEADSADDEGEELNVSAEPGAEFHPGEPRLHPD